jgi:hypothetical protein
VVEKNRKFWGTKDSGFLSIKYPLIPLTNLYPDKRLRVGGLPTLMGMHEASAEFRVYICNQIHVALQDERDRDSATFQAWIIQQGLVQILSTVFIESSQGPCDLSDILSFCKTIQAAKKAHSGKRLLITLSPVLSVQITAIFLVGSHAILSGCSYDEVVSSFETCINLLESVKYSVDLTILDFWRAMARSKELNWIGERSQDDAESDFAGLNMEEYAHYVR